MRKKTFSKVTSLFLCAAVTAAGFCGCQSSTDNGAAASSIESSLEETVTGLSGNNGKNVLSPNSRQETVYVFSNADGSTDHISVHEKNVDSDGNETLTKTESDKELPVTMKITYTLDGKEMTPENLAGKSGHLTVRFDYTNHLETDVTINGKKQTVCVPFTMITGMALPTDVYSNITVTNGKLTQVGDDVVAVGITMPGLSDTLSMKFNDKDLDLEIPEFFEVSADVTDFYSEMTMSAATSNLLTDADIDKLTLEDLQNAADSLTDSTTQLADGAAQLADGVGELVKGTSDLTAGTDKLLSGSSELVDATAKLADGTASLAAGSNQLKTSLENGISQAESSYKTAYDSFYQIAFSVSCISNGIDPNTASAEQQAVIAAAMEQGGLSRSADITSSSQYAVATGFILKNYTAVQQVVSASLSAVSGGTLDAETLKQKADEQIVTVTSGLSQAYQAYSDCSTTLASLENSGFFSGMNKLNESALFLSAGTVSLYNGAKSLKDGADKLTAGSNTLFSGASSLKDGMVRFNSEGITPVCNLIQTDAQGALDKIKAVIRAGQEYSSYLGYTDEKEGSVIFIYKTEGISSESES